MNFPQKLEQKLQTRESDGLLRKLTLNKNLIDFSSNDYLGLAKSEALHQLKLEKLTKLKLRNGSAGSRLIRGNSEYYETVEQKIADFHGAEDAIIFNSGYDANMGLLSSVPLKNDIVLYDELIHASLLDGMRLSFAYCYKFEHNNLTELEELILRHKGKGEIYIVVESIYSMDGDAAPLVDITELAEDHNCFVIVDEAHATGIFGEEGKGLCYELQIEDKCFARIHTFGKALGVHGAAVVGSKRLKEYLVNYGRSFIYTTALPNDSLCAIDAAYETIAKQESLTSLQNNIELFNKHTGKMQNKIASESAIHCFLFPGNENVQNASNKLMELGFDVKSIKSPTVAVDKERLRVCLHSYNTKEEVISLANALSNLN